MLNHIVKGIEIVVGLIVIFGLLGLLELWAINKRQEYESETRNLDTTDKDSNRPILDLEIRSGDTSTCYDRSKYVK